MSAPVYSTLQLISRLIALNVADYPAVEGEEALIRLYKNDVTPDANQTLDTFVEADFDAYAAVPLIMTSPTVNDQGMVVSRSNACEFPGAAGIDPQTIYGVYITDFGGTKVIAAQRFDTPQEMGGVLPSAISGLWRTSEPLTSYGWIDTES